MHSSTKHPWMHIGLWLGWSLVLLALALSGALPLSQLSAVPGLAGTLTPAPRLTDPPVLALVVTAEPRFPWQPRGRWRKWALAHWQAALWAYQRARWLARLARLGQMGALSFASVVD